MVADNRVRVGVVLLEGRRGLVPLLVADEAHLVVLAVEGRAFDGPLEELVLFVQVRRVVVARRRRVLVHQ